jgi:hypothetical protein
MLHSTTFEVAGKLCLCLHLDHSHTQDINIMEYQKKCKARLINQMEINKIQRNLQCVQELTLFQYIQVAGGNKYRKGYLYKITAMGESNTLKAV